MKAEVVLTVAESKRLIAKGVAALDIVQRKLDQGVILLTAGGTNAYLYEELLGQSIDKRGFMRGRTAPAGSPPTEEVAAIPDLVLVNGQPRPDLDRFSALAHMSQGDIYIKGANALNYAEGVAGVTIGHPMGGTLGGGMGAIIGRKLHLLIPVGLEKEVPFDIDELSALLSDPDEQTGVVHSLWPLRGDIFTEIEALNTLCYVEAMPVAAGGVAGAEGGMRLLIRGESPDVRKALTLIQAIQGEPALQ
jgi:hypothetical protein